MFKRGVEVKRVVILTGKTDMRRGIDGFVSIVRLKYNLDPLDKGSLFLLCGTKRDRIKCPFSEGDGFTSGYKRLSQGYYKWPRNAEEARTLTWEDYDRLIDGFEIESSIKGL